MSPFRGVSMDSGTAFEMGFMAAAGKTVLGYTNVAKGFAERSAHYYVSGAQCDVDRYSEGTSIERFEMADNLMMVERLGRPVRGRFDGVPSGEELLDVRGFAACLALLADRERR